MTLFSGIISRMERNAPRKEDLLIRESDIIIAPDPGEPPLMIERNIYCGYEYLTFGHVDSIYGYINLGNGSPGRKIRDMIIKRSGVGVYETHDIEENGMEGNFLHFFIYVYDHRLWDPILPAKEAAEICRIAIDVLNENQMTCCSEG